MFSGQLICLLVDDRVFSLDGGEGLGKRFVTPGLVVVVV